MSQIEEHDFTANLFKLLAETFEGPPGVGGSAYLDKGAGLFQTLARIDAAAASRSVGAGIPTIAAHCIHASYYIDVLHTFLRGEEQRLDWAGSWQRQQVDADEWDALRDELRARYEALRATLEAVETWGDDPVGDSMAIVVHTAYHLGAIRQLLHFASCDPA